MFVALGINQQFEFQQQDACIYKQAAYGMCRTPFAERVHRLGIFLTQPLLREISIATQLFGPHAWPGRSEETVTNWDRTVRVLRGIELFTLVVPLIAGVLGVIGLCLKFIAVQWSAPASLLENRGIPFKSCRGEIDLMTYNVCLAPTYMTNINGMREPRGRAIQIVGELSGEAAPDIVCFQEGFHADAIGILCQGLQHTYPHVLHNVAPNEVFLNSGLVVASKYRICEVHYRPFTNCSGEDRLANKGLLRVTLDLGEGRTAVVYNTHLQAKSQEPYETLRQEQIRFIRKAVLADCEGENHASVVLCGDFNLHPNELAEAQRILGEEFVRQPMDPEEGTAYDQETSWGTHDWRREKRADQLDHIFVFQGRTGRAHTVQLGLDDRTLLSGYSDHLPVRSRLRLS